MLEITNEERKIILKLKKKNITIVTQVLKQHLRSLHHGQVWTGHLLFRILCWCKFLKSEKLLVAYNQCWKFHQLTF